MVLLKGFLVSLFLVGCATGRVPSEPVVETLEIVGNEALSDRQIEKRILTTETGWWPFATKYRFDPVVWGTDLKRIKRLYGSHGFYQAEIVRTRVDPVPPRGVGIEVEVREGEATHVTALDVLGLEDLPPSERDALIADLPLHLAEVFEEDHWAAAKNLLHQRLQERGYAEVEVDGAALIDVKTREARLRLLVRLGDVYRFGAIQIDVGEGDAIQGAWIWDQVRLAIPEGELYSPGALVEAQRRVSNMGVFAVVKVTSAAPDHASKQIAVNVETREAPLHTLKLGGGVRIDQVRNETRLVAEWTNRNFRGGMRRLTLRGEAGWAFIPNAYAVATNDQSIKLRNGPIARTRLEFEQPQFLGRASLRERSSVEVARTLEQAYDDLGGRLSNGVIWQPRSSLTIFPSHHLQGDQLNGSAGAAALSAPLTLGCQTTSDSCFVWLSYIEEIITWDRRDDALEPRKGWYASLSLQQGGGPLLGDFNYYRVLPDLRGYISFGDEQDLTIASRLRVGGLFPTSGDAKDSAVVTRFYGGGAQSMRGFNDRRLSPLLLSQLPASPGNPNPPLITLPIGGDGMIDGSVEIRYHVTPNLIVAGFVDFGQVTRAAPTANDFIHVMVAVGAGLRYLTPVGPVRLDFGRRLQVGRPPLLFAVDAAGRITEQPYNVDNSCLGIGGSGGSIVSDNLCALHISIGEAF